MATNPMQRKARNSFLLGMLVTLLIAAVVIGLMFMQLSKLQQEKKTLEASYKTVALVTSDIKSGETVLNKITTQTIAGDAVPANAILMANITETMIAKVDLFKGTVLSASVVTEPEDKLTSDVREQQYNMVILPQQLEDEDYIDIRLSLPSGHDYVVVAKKHVKRQEEETIWIDMAEEEILTMNNAIVEAYKIPGSKLYATRYVEPGLQGEAAITYPVSGEIRDLIRTDPNVVEVAKEELIKRYDAAQEAQRQNILNATLQSVAEEADQNLQTKVEEEITKTQESRKNYLDGM